MVKRSPMDCRANKILQGVPRSVPRFRLCKAYGATGSEAVGVTAGPTTRTRSFSGMMDLSMGTID